MAELTGIQKFFPYKGLSYGAEYVEKQLKYAFFVYNIFPHCLFY